MLSLPKLPPLIHFLTNTVYVGPKPGAGKDERMFVLIATVVVLAAIVLLAAT